MALGSNVCQRHVPFVQPRPCCRLLGAHRCVLGTFPAGNSPLQLLFLCRAFPAMLPAARAFCPHCVLMQGEGLVPIASTTWVCKVIGKGLLRQNICPPVPSCSTVPLGNGKWCDRRFLAGKQPCCVWGMEDEAGDVQGSSDHRSGALYCCNQSSGSQVPKFSSKVNRREFPILKNSFQPDCCLGFGCAGKQSLQNDFCTAVQGFLQRGL